MTLEEAVAAYSLAYGHRLYTSNWSDGEKEFVMSLLAELKHTYYSLNAGDILSCARDPELIAGYSSVHVDSEAMKAIDKDFPITRKRRTGHAD